MLGMRANDQEVRMFRTITYICFCFMILCAPATLSQGTGKGSNAPKSSSSAGKVEVKSFVRVFIAPDRPAYSVTYEYAFPGRSSVRVSGLGDVPATGSFHYLTQDKQLEFKDPTSGTLLMQIPLVETIIVAAKPPLNQVPSDNDFPVAFRSFTWNSANNFQERANAVLGKYFRYLPRNDRGVTSIATTFAPLQLQATPKGVLAQVALLISFPYQVTTGEYSFHIQTAVKEGRSLSDDYRETGDPSIVHSADSFVDRLITEMRTTGGGQP
jgi:hypothetical protein